MLSRSLHKMSRRCLLLAGSALISTSLATAQEQPSPFAGTEDVGPMASRQLTWNQPSYDAPGVQVESSALGATSLGAAQLVTQSAASQIQAQLPAGVTVRAGAGDASLVSIGLAQSAPDDASVQDQDIDPEQAQELNEIVDPEQVAELGGRAAADPVQKWIVHYPVAFQGVPVAYYADVVAFIDQSGNIQQLRKRNLPQSANATTATVSAASAQDAAVSDAGSWAQDAETSGPELELWVNPDGSGELAYRIEMTSTDLTDPNARRYWISAVGEPRVIYWESMIRHTHNGQVTGTIWTESGRPDRPTANQEFEKMLVNRTGGGGGSATTGANGLYSLTTGGGLATMQVNLNGNNTCSKIDNMAGGELSRSKAGTPVNPIDLTFNASGIEELAQTSALYWTNKSCEMAKDILAPTDLPSLPTNVNINGQCNAFWNGSSINFYKAGGNCPNMAYSDVVAHEYGHGIDARKGGILDGGYSEGFGDAMAILLTRQSCVGRDFFGAGTCLREASDLIMWPPAGNEGVHAQGRRYAGFTNQLIIELKKTYSDDGAYAIATQLVMASAKANPNDIPDAVKLAFIADDDDNDLTNGTPHFDELAAAADSRNLPRPAGPSKKRSIGYAWAHSPTSAAYTPSTTYSFNSSGGAIKATRSGTGQYSMIFAGLGGNGRAGGNVQVTSYGPSSDFCKVYWWSSGGKDFTANVRCFKPTGALVDTRYTVLITWP